jgi:hypothetical protein
MEKKKIDEAGRVDVKVPSVQDIMGKKQPEKKFRAGPVSATIWLNHGKDSEGKETTYKTVSFERSYMDKEGNWQTTNSLRAGDLPRAVLVLNKAYEYLSLSDGEHADEE